jgi:pyruvate/2-oxoglutarate dehydrogenase complex dihydrolipoamide acyltransferase (E2) component
VDIDEVVIPVPTKTARDASIVVLFAAPGDTIRRNQLIALLEGDKGVLQVSSPVSGVVKEVQVKVGARVAPGSPMLTLDRIEGRGRRSGERAVDTHPVPALPVQHGSQHFPALTAPTLGAFKRQIEDVLGGALTRSATLAVADFWSHWKAFSEGLALKGLAVQFDLEHPPAGQRRPVARDYHSVQRLARPLVLTGLLLVFFLWQVAVAVIALGLAVHYAAAYLITRDNDLRNRHVVPPAEHAPCEPAMANLCAQYILGMVAFISPAGRAHWPDYPSNVLTGKRVRIPGAQPRTDP